MSQNSESNTIENERSVVNAQDNVQIREIIENAARVQRVTNKLCEGLSQVEDVLEDLLEKYDLTHDLEAFDFRGFGLRRCGSRLGTYIHIVYLDNSLLLPSSSDQVGKGFYYHGDFNCWYDYMYRELIIDFAHSLREFLENFNNVLVKIAKETQIEIPAISISRGEV